MRFLVMHKMDAKMEAGGPPDQRIIAEMGELVGESVKSGVCLDGAGLHPSARRARIKAGSGGTTVERGPYAGDNELVASVAMVKTRSLDEATELAARLAKAGGSLDVEIGSVVEAWDLGIMPKPKQLEHERFLLLLKGNAKTESGAAPTADERARSAALAEELEKRGALLKRIALAPTSKAKRLPSGPKDKRAWIDGPFAESKELISGFALLELPSMAEAVTWANRYAAILGDNEVDIRVVAD
jgi:hypothetical protein